MEKSNSKVGENNYPNHQSGSIKDQNTLTNPIKRQLISRAIFVFGNHSLTIDGINGEKPSKYIPMVCLFVMVLIINSLAFRICLLLLIIYLTGQKVEIIESLLKTMRCVSNFRFLNYL